jgi:uncharacterized protein YndB with AHSA1/START domain
MSALLSISATVEAPIVTVWDYWNKPEHIVNWYSAGDSLHALTAANVLSAGGLSRRKAAEGGAVPDNAGEYTDIEFLKKICFRRADGRNVTVRFDAENGRTVVTETVDYEDLNPTDQQKDGLQSVLDSFKNYAESSYLCC